MQPPAPNAKDHAAMAKQRAIVMSPTMMTSTSPMNTTMHLSMTSHLNAKELVQGAQYKLTAAATVLLCLILVGAILLVIKQQHSQDDTPADTDLTYPQLETTTATVMEASVIYSIPMQTTPKKSTVMGPRTLLCTYGTNTKMTTLFPEDGICDVMFFDSAYKDGINVPSLQLTFGESINAFLAAASRYQSTQFGVAFDYKYAQWLATDLKATNPILLNVFWRSGVFHFGIIDMPASGVSKDNITSVFAVLKTLSMVAMKRPATLGKPYIALGAVPQTDIDIYASQMKDVYTPTLFISHGHYAFGDNTVADCRVVPPTMLLKPNGSQAYTYDLRIQDAGVSAKWLVSVGMKGRRTTVKTNFSLELLSECKADLSEKSFGTYVEVCSSDFYRQNLKYVERIEAMYTFNTFHRSMFVYDNEESLCIKMCQAKSTNNALQFGIAVYDLEYEDYNNNCSSVNVYGAFSRLKMIRKLLDYFQVSSAGGSSCTDDVPCPKGASP